MSSLFLLWACMANESIEVFCDDGKDEPRGFADILDNEASGTVSSVLVTFDIMCL